ncbi:MAG: ribonuclease D [Cycloclasticus sp. symbiont of Poecilosclerida sp. N]|nr:MAG: ribonuclease D [Cycloclasticus sp. symbiont of Poecilosclerida sp. N]
MTQPQYINTSEQLVEFCKRIETLQWLAIDTEFQREKTYRSILALIQIATTDLVAIIDPLACDIKPLLEVLSNKNILKVFHAARQDQEIFYDLLSEPLSPVFDTQIAAPLLGHPKQAGYARLVDDILGVQLSKAHSRTDWLRRPLSDEQITYAADDVIYLAKLYPLLEKKLTQKGRLNWLAPAFSDLCKTSLYTNPPELAWKRIRAAKRLKGASLCVLQKLSAWREELAQSKNIPRGWLIKDDILVEIAKMKPTSTQTMSLIRGVSDKFIEKFGPAVIKIINAALEQEPASQEKQKKSKKANENQEAIADLLMAQVRLKAAINGVNPTSLTSRKELLHLIQGERDIELLKDWRNDMIGKELVATLNGHNSFNVCAGELIIK